MIYNLAIFFLCVYLHMCVWVFFILRVTSCSKWSEVNATSKKYFISPKKKNNQQTQKKWFKETLNQTASLTRFGNLEDWSEFPLCCNGQHRDHIIICQDTCKSFPSKHRLKTPLQEESSRKVSQNISYKIHLARYKHLKYRNLHIKR